MATLLSYSKIAISRKPNQVNIINSNWTDPSPQPKSHAAEPIKDPDDIRRICEYLVANNRYRDNLLFTAGINLGFRCGDLMRLKWGHFFSPDSSPRDSIILREDKTDKYRVVYPNEAVWSAVYLYAEHLDELYGGVDLDSFLFRSESNRCKENKPLDNKSVERILKQLINVDMGIKINASTHCLRKTFGYHMVMGAKDRTRAVELLCKIFNHSSTIVTLSYIGITDDEIRDAYENLNLGLLNPAACIRLGQDQTA